MMSLPSGDRGKGRTERLDATRRSMLVPTPGGLHRITGSKASFGFDGKDNSLINNRQNGRRRGRGGGNNNPRQGGGGGGRADSANRIDSRARGNANQLYEKYKNLARDAQMSGDRVNIEYYLQFADHYFRVLADTRSRTEDNNQPRRQQPFDLDGDDDDDINEGEPIRAGEQNGRDERQARDRDNRDGRGSDQRDQRDRDGGDRNNRNQRRDRDNDRDGEERAPRPRRDRFERPERESEEGGATQVEAIQQPVAEQEEAPAPRRRGRPRKEQPQDEGNATIAADVLPPSVSAANDEGAAPKPRRRRTVRASDEVPSAAE